MNTNTNAATQSDRPADMLLVRLTIGRFGNRKQGDMSEVTSAADKEMLRLSKVLLTSDAHEAIRRFDAESIGFVRDRSVPSFFKKGVYQIRVEAVEPIATYLDERIAKRAALVSAAGADYDQCVEDARTKLGPQFNGKDYPTRVEYEARYYMEYAFVAFDTPSELKGISAALFNAERAKMRAAIEQAQRDAIALVRFEWQKTVAHFTEKMTDEKKGKRKVFRDSIVENLRETLDCFTLRNVANDAELEEQIAKMRALASRIPSADALRDSDSFRAKMADGFGQIKKTLDKLVTDAPLRSLDFD